MIDLFVVLTLLGSVVAILAFLGTAFAELPVGWVDDQTSRWDGNSHRKRGPAEEPSPHRTAGPRQPTP